MTIIKKLNNQQQFKGILLFKDGVFLRAYNQGVYILTELLGYRFNVRVMQLKKYQNRYVVTCAFPFNKLSKRLPEAVITDFGGQLAHEFDMAAYHAWFKRRCLEVSFTNLKTRASSESLQTIEWLASEPSPDSDNHTDTICFTVSWQQVAFLKNWQPNSYPIEVDHAFIQSLKNKFFK